MVDAATDSTPEAQEKSKMVDAVTDSTPEAQENLMAKRMGKRECQNCGVG